MGIGDFSFLTRAPGLRYASKSIIFNGGAGRGLVASVVPWFNITGAIHMERLSGFVKTALVSTLNTGTLSLGVTGGGTAIAAAVVVNGANFAVNQHWAAATPGSTITQMAQAFRESVISAAQMISNVTINDITQGELILTISWYPVSDGGLLVPA